MIDGPCDACGDVRVVGGTPGEHLHWHHPAVPEHTGRAEAVVRVCRDLSGDVTTNTLLAAGTEFQSWHARWQERLSRQPQSREEVRALMRRRNPAFIPRNHKVEEALTAATQSGDLSVMKKLLDVLMQPFDYTRDLPEFSTPGPSSGQPYQTFCGT